MEERNFDCDWLLVAGGNWQEDLPSASDWELVWEVRRPSNPTAQPREIFALLKRNGGKRMCNDSILMIGTENHKKYLTAE